MLSTEHTGGQSPGGRQAGSSQTNGKDSGQNRPPEKKVSVQSKAKDSWVEFFYVYFLNLHLFKIEILSLSGKFYAM